MRKRRASYPRVIHLSLDVRVMHERAERRTYFRPCRTVDIAGCFSGGLDSRFVFRAPINLSVGSHAALHPPDHPGPCTYYRGVSCRLRPWCRTSRPTVDERRDHRGLSVCETSPVSGKHRDLRRTDRFHTFSLLSSPSQSFSVYSFFTIILRAMRKSFWRPGWEKSIVRIRREQGSGCRGLDTSHWQRNAMIRGV